METDSFRDVFIRELSEALHHLYDPSILRRSPLISLFGLDRQADAVPALRHILSEGIESIKPRGTVPSAANAWRVYYILYYRYTEQLLQRDVAAELGLSTRQLRRQEQTALQVLADYLVSSYQLEQKVQHFASDVGVEELDPSASAAMPSREQELDWIERTMLSEPVAVADLLASVLDTVRPLIQTLRVSLDCNVPDDLPALIVQPTTLRQALLYIIARAANLVPQGRVMLWTETLAWRAHVQIKVKAQQVNDLIAGSDDKAENLHAVRELVQMSGGSLQLTADTDAHTPFSATVTLPAAEQVPILVIDDNVDTLNLMRRYLSGSRYRFIGAASPQEGQTLAEQVHPAAILLDVMLPEVDGWEVLSQLREHPATRGVPVIVCTILPHDKLAFALGAADFLRKPVSRGELLSVLARQIER